MTATLLLLPLLSLVLPGTQGEDPPPPAEMAQQYARLSNVKKALVVRALENRAAEDADPYVRRVTNLRRGFRGYPERERDRYHDPSIWAPGVAPARTEVQRGTARHNAVRKKIPKVPYLDDLNRSVTYDWGRGVVVRESEAPTFDEIFARAARGYLPGSDEAVARVLQELDRDPRARPVADWFAHLYADLEAKVYEGVTLYEAWYSGEIVDVPDVDAIPFERKVLGTASFVSPIPADGKRTHLYQQIQAAARLYRVYRTLREAAAAAFVHRDPVIDPVYRELLPRFHFLWEEAGHDPERLAERLAELGSRDALLHYVDGAVRAGDEGFEKRERAGEALQAMNAKVRLWAWEELRRAGSGG